MDEFESDSEQKRTDEMGFDGSGLHGIGFD
jgi:hypothetical protein